MKKYFIGFLLLFFFRIMYAAQTENRDELLVGRICEILLENYDKHKCADPIEQLILLLGRNSYVKFLTHWQYYGTDVSEARLELDASFKDVLKIINKYLPAGDADYFTRQTGQLVALGLQNFQMYYNAVLKNGNPVEPGALDTGEIDRCLKDPVFFDIQKNLYAREETILSEIREVMTDKRVQPKLQFYLLFYDLICSYRLKTMHRLLNNYYVLAGPRD